MSEPTQSNLEVRAFTAPWYSGIEVLIRSGKAVGTNIVMTEVEPHVKVQPTFTLSHEQAQRLMDDLWQAGIRPTEGSGSAGAMRATERHLEDMRRLVFDLSPK